VARGPYRSKEIVISRSLAVLIAAVVAALAAVPALAGGGGGSGTVNVPQKLSSQIAKVKARGKVAVRLPSRLDAPVSPRSLKGGGGPTKRGYNMFIGLSSNCNGANVCLLAGFTARAGGKPTYNTKVRLARGRTGYFKRITCPSSCNPARIQWVQGGVLYGIHNKNVNGTTERKVMVGLANQAIRAGAR
jgi:hypothetical protein